MTWRGTGRDRASAHRRRASYTEVHPLRVPAGQKGTQKWEEDGGSWRDQQREDKVTKWTMEGGSGSGARDGGDGDRPKVNLGRKAEK